LSGERGTQELLDQELLSRNFLRLGNRHVGNGRIQGHAQRLGGHQEPLRDQQHRRSLFTQIPGRFKESHLGRPEPAQRMENPV